MYNSVIYVLLETLYENFARTEAKSWFFFLPQRDTDFSQNFLENHETPFGHYEVIFVNFQSCRTQLNINFFFHRLVI